MSAAVELLAVGKRYGRHWAAREVSLTLAAGERLALLGHNGAGKTTLLKLMLGLIRPDGGGIAVLGHPVGDPTSPIRRAIGFLPENVVFHEALTGRETIEFYARLKGCPCKEGHRLLDRVGLAAAAGRRVGTYSKGMRQRLGLAQALLGKTRLLLLDEPTTGLDPALRHAFYEIVRDLAEDGAAVLLSSHLLTELEERTDRIAVMDQGRLVALGTLEELRVRAGLPIRLRLSVPEARRAEAGSALATLSPTPEAGYGWIIACTPANKMALLRHALAAAPFISDIDIVQPGLDAIYATFTGGAIDKAAS